VWTEDRSQLPALAALLVAGVAALVFSWLAKVTKKKFFDQMSFPGGMLVGMLGAYICNLFLV